MGKRRSSSAEKGQRKIRWTLTGGQPGSVETVFAGRSTWRCGKMVCLLSTLTKNAGTSKHTKVQTKSPMVDSDREEQRKAAVSKVSGKKDNRTTRRSAPRCILRSGTREMQNKYEYMEI